ncbi:MAG: hypothetical protein J0H17_22685 [Rhizobiales bacterium]|nr:hypothetical protein [Hyphomicrobiales bacterium]
MPTMGGLDMRRIIIVLSVAIFCLCGTTSRQAVEAAGIKIDKSESAQKKRKALMKKLMNLGIFLKVEVPGSLPRLYVRPKFYALDIDTKSSFVSVVYAYYFDGTDESALVRIFDGQNGKEIGSYSIVGGGLKLK